MIGDGAAGATSSSPYTAFGSEPFTPFNLLTYKTFQMQDSVTRFANNHSLTFGGALEKFHSDNSFYFGIQSSYSYNSLADFYTDANGYLANPTRTVSPVTLGAFQVKFLLQPGQTTPPLQPLDVWYASGYFQDEWRPRSNMTVTAGLRVDVPKFGNTAFDNPVADSLTFRDQNGSPVMYNSGALPSTTGYWSPRAGLNWDLFGDRDDAGPRRQRPVHGQAAVRLDLEPDRQHRGPVRILPTPGTRAPSRSTRIPTPTSRRQPGGSRPATSSTSPIRASASRRPGGPTAASTGSCPWGLVGTVDYIYNRDLNDPVYINANLPAAESAYTGVDNRPRWVATPAFPTCAATGQVGPCVTRLNNAVGDQVTAAYVIKNQNQNRSWNIARSLAKPMTHGFAFKGGFNYGVSKSVVEPSSTAGSSWGGSNPVPGDPNNPPLAYSINSPGKRVFLQASYSHEYFHFGATTISAFYDAHPNIPAGFFGPNTSYVFSGDANGDGQTNDLIYIPRNMSEMNFKPLTVSGKTFTAAQQAAAFEQYIENDSYLSSHRGQYAERGAVFFPMVDRVDLSITQDVFHNIGGAKHSGQIRLDITNFGNLLNHNWGVGQRLVNNADPDQCGRGCQRRARLHLQPATVSTATC